MDLQHRDGVPGSWESSREGKDEAHVLEVPVKDQVWADEMNVALTQRQRARPLEALEADSQPRRRKRRVSSSPRQEALHRTLKVPVLPTSPVAPRGLSTHDFNPLFPLV